MIDFDTPTNNDWLAVNQFTVRRGPAQAPAGHRAVRQRTAAGGDRAEERRRRERRRLDRAYNQLQTYQSQIPALFAFNEALVVSDGTQARIGSPRRRARVVHALADHRPDEAEAPLSLTQLEVLLKGVFEPERFLHLVRHFIVFEDRGAGHVTKKMAGYHQFHAVNAAVEETLRAAPAVAHAVGEAEGRFEAGGRPGGEPGDKRVGVVWHTQGSGKSLTMAFYAGRIILHPAMANPTIVVLTDRNDLDDQLFGTFSALPGPAAAAARPGREPRRPAREARRRAGGVVFTTIQKFFPDEKGDRHPVLSERRNIVVIADEAHRSQYDFIDGFARHMRDALPNASFIGFTGTPIETDGHEHAGRVRRLHQRLRHPARRRGRRHGAHLLREPPRKAGA